ncbi:MAG: TonB-dependent receptor [Alphaproteobacteria bacterium]|nr:TonB-dependent receptor [Alphaproteobacteria bacterium]
MTNKRLLKIALMAGVALSAPVSASAGAVFADFAGLHTLVRFDLDTKPLTETLIEFTDITGLGLVFDSRLVAGKTGPALSGEFSAKVALDLLLADSGLMVVDVGGDTLALVKKTEKVDTQTLRLEVAPEIISTGIDTAASSVIDELLILGTRTANPPYHKFKPTVAISGEKLRSSGTVNVSDYLFQLPSMLSDITAASTTIFGTPAGLNLADLRGMGTERTLVLINGRRAIPTYGGSLTLYGVDLNTIPSGLVERIDVINGGASTTFGPEAVAGVVNFELRKDVDGWGAAVQAGITERGDREELLATLTYGTDFADGRGNFVISLTADDQAGLLLGEREVTADPGWFAINGMRGAFGEGEFTPGFGGSPTISQGLWQGVVYEDGAVEFFPQTYTFSDDGTAIEANTGQLHQLYNYASEQTLVTPLNRTFVTTYGSYEVGSGHKLIFQGNFADTNVTSQLAPIPLSALSGLATETGSVTAVPFSNPYVPSSLLDQVATMGLVDPAGIILSRRFEELGPRATNISRSTLGGMVGLQGMLAPGWSYDFYYQYGRNKVNEERDGLLDMTNFRASLDPELCAQIVGCSVINPFGVGNISSEQVAFLKAPNAIRNIEAGQHIVSAVFSGPLDMLPETEGKISFGLEYRHEYLKDTPDPALEARPVSGSLIFPGSNGNFDAFEAFADVTLPLLSGQEMFEELTVTMGGRVSEFSTTGTIGNWHVGGVWKPFEELAFRVSYQSGRRAPNIAELYSGGPGGTASYDDPCSNLQDSDTGVVAQNCRSDVRLGVPEDFVQSRFVADVNSFGNPNLKAEKNSNLSWGATFEVKNVFNPVHDQFRLSVDAYVIEVKDFISTLGAAQVLDLCYESANFDNAFCGINPITDAPYILRDPSTSDLSLVTSSIINAGHYRLKGYDVEMQYVADLSALGTDLFFDQISFTGLYTRSLEVTFQAEEGGTVDNILGDAKYPKHRFQGGITLSKDRYALDWDVRYRGKATSLPDMEDPLPEALLPDVWYHDVGMRYGLKDGLTIYGGVRNLFDRKAPRVFLGSVSNTFPEFYDTLGRRFYLGAVIDF